MEERIAQVEIDRSTRALRPIFRHEGGELWSSTDILEDLRRRENKSARKNGTALAVKTGDTSTARAGVLSDPKTTRSRWVEYTPENMAPCDG